MVEIEGAAESCVVWLDPAGSARCSGRVEHVSTSRRETFETADELIAFLLASRGGSRPAIQGEADVES